MLCNPTVDFDNNYFVICPASGGFIERRKTEEEMHDIGCKKMFTLEAERLVYWICKDNLKWTRFTHYNFPKSVRDKIFFFLCCHSKSYVRLFKDLVFMICASIARQMITDYWQIYSANESYCVKYEEMKPLTLQNNLYY